MHGTQMARAIIRRVRADDEGGLVRSIPSPITRFVGRVSDLQRLPAQVDRDRLVTLTGAGGITVAKPGLPCIWRNRCAMRDLPSSHSSILAR